MKKSTRCILDQQSSHSGKNRITRHTLTSFWKCCPLFLGMSFVLIHDYFPGCQCSRRWTWKAPGLPPSPALPGLQSIIFHTALQPEPLRLPLCRENQVDRPSRQSAACLLLWSITMHVSYGKERRLCSYTIKYCCNSMWQTDTGKQAYSFNCCLSILWSDWDFCITIRDCQTSDKVQSDMKRWTMRRRKGA